MRFRKLPVIVDAIQWDGTMEKLKKIKELAGGDSVLVQYIIQEDSLYVLTNTPQKVLKGDWVVRDHTGSLYPVPKRNFELSYELVR